jgi:hypothetical protein
MMLSDADILRSAHLMIDAYGGDAELEAAKYAGLMLGCDDRGGLAFWAKIWRMIAEMRQAPTDLPH